jgi:hypothetical protein
MGTIQFCQAWGNLRMRPSRRDCDINDILQKLLDKGLVLNADLILFVAGVPLLGVNLKAAIAGMETMLEYGMMEAWDKRTREWYEKEYAKKAAVPLATGEEIMIKAHGSVWNNQGILNTWKPGTWYLTNNRIFLWRREPAEIVFEAPLYEIEGFMAQKETGFKTDRDELYLQFTGGEVGRVYALDVGMFKEAVENALLASLNRTNDHKMK